MGDVALPTPLGKAAQQANDWEEPQPALKYRFFGGASYEAA